jgi:hypothetical protein
MEMVLFSVEIIHKFYQNRRAAKCGTVQHVSKKRRQQKAMAKDSELPCEFMTGLRHDFLCTK